MFKKTIDSKIIKDGKSKLCTTRRIAEGKRVFQNRKHVLTTGSTELDTGENILKIY